ncbi:hypothetical protein [Deinococcus sedimenti]|uniref:Uncharacterized protein n=1 Tax=Deinococcus sedimenti TaxID=1867090 RepID=A0ABQ2RYJ3_9DEIO|nr:hypothetical protein [Deinococcus sedimenti]GGR81046.1 hypothetical protein GCM10008960_04940 [Deinococcus sedimenti]
MSDLSLPLAVTLALLALYWLGRVAQAARDRLAPRLTYWAAPGLGAMLLAPLLDVPALFGVGAGLLLLAEYWPAAFQPSRTRPSPSWPFVVALLGAGLGVNVLRGDTDPWITAISAALLLAGLAGLLAAAAFRPWPTTPTLTFATRWKTVTTPDWPELTVTLSDRGAHLRNVSGHALRMAGWSPAGLNAWLPVRTEGGEAVRELAAGQEALLPVQDSDHGVRVWYAPARGDATHLFRADWTPPARADDRILN